ncbi:MAG: ABC transporter ATP-binding protein [Lachnospiraceae bacterium]|nr:ABC transporter ATP-binding protein [Lachnospiraceae bacterium]
MILEFINVTGTSKKYALQDINFSLEAGYIMGLAGKNGAGKSTLLDYIMNPRQQYSGEIRINGVNIRDNHRNMMNKIGFISDNNSFFLERTAEQNGEILGPLYEVWDKGMFYSAMKKMELSPKKTLGKMSRGEMFKFQTAFAMAHKPAIYLIDEATAGMDPVFRIDYFKMLQEIIADEKASIIMTSHIQDEIHRKMDYVGIMEDGRLVKFGDTLSVFQEV